MRVCHTLICCFFLSLQDGNTDLVSDWVHSGIEGGEVTVHCSFSSPGVRARLCKNQCKREDVLIETSEVTAQNDRYIIRQTRRSMDVTITHLNKSDSGRYHCRLVISQSEYLDKDFEIIVIDARLHGRRPPSGQKLIQTKTGGSVTVECVFTSSGTWKFFCREDCREPTHILIETVNNRDQRDRYNIRFEIGREQLSVFVTITQLTNSDSGQYRCGLDRTLSSGSYRDFEINVTDAIVSPPLPTTTSTTQSLNFSPQSKTTTTEELMLYVGLTLAIVVVLLSVTAVIFCRKKTSQPEEPPKETESASVTVENRVYEDIGHSTSPPVDTSSLYSHIQPRGIKTNDDYTKAEDESSKLIYAQVNFSNRTTGSSNNTLPHRDNDVVYSMLQVPENSDASRAGDDVSPYSVIDSYQK